LGTQHNRAMTTIGTLRNRAKYRLGVLGARLEGGCNDTARPAPAIAQAVAATLRSLFCRYSTVEKALDPRFKEFDSSRHSVPAIRTKYGPQ
jgi:hypothetical protein